MGNFISLGLDENYDKNIYENYDKNIYENYDINCFDQNNLVKLKDFIQLNNNIMIKYNLSLDIMNKDIEELKLKNKLINSNIFSNNIDIQFESMFDKLIIN